jgi:aminoglycoside phosphotransferase (APT) family kinase protein
MTPGRRDRSHANAAEARRLVEAALGGTRISTFRILGRGTDHTAYEVDGGLIARFTSTQDPETAAATAWEIEILQLADRVSTVPVPEVLGADTENGLVITRKLMGSSLLDAPTNNPHALIDQLAEFLAGLHAVRDEDLPPAIEVDWCPPTAFLADASTNLAVLAPVVTSEQLRLVTNFLNTAPPPAPSHVALCHNDLGAEHILAAADRTTLTGIIDWSDAAITDAARDLGRIYRDLGPSTAERVLEQLTIDDKLETWRRTTFHARCALLEDLAYGLTIGDARYSDAALANLTRTFTEA